MEDRLSRREFLEKSGKAAVGIGLGAMVADALATPVRAQTATVSPNEKIFVGTIGCGGMGRGLTNGFMNQPDAVIAAVCDVDSRHLDQAADEIEKKSGKKPDTYKDFRQLLERKDIDAVVIGTPDHWHALPFVLACEAGKDIYVEKPISHNIVEGQAMLGAANHFKRVVQVGTQQRSIGHFQRAIEFARSGKMGKITVCRAWICGGGGVGKKQATDPPKELDWDMWLGPAPKVPYRSNRCHNNFRWFYDYAGGMAGDWGVHMIDIVLLGMNAWHPLSVSSYGGKFLSGEDDDRDTPDTQIAVYQFPDFVLQWEVHVGEPGLDGGRNHGSEFIGEKGVLIVDRHGITWRPREEGGEGPSDEPAGGSHQRDFLDNIKSRGKCISDIETMHWTTTACHLANISYRIGRSVKWDGEKGVVVGDKDAMQNSSYRREYRKPWTLPMYKA